MTKVEELMKQIHDLKEAVDKKGTESAEAHVEAEKRAADAAQTAKESGLLLRKGEFTDTGLDRSYFMSKEWRRSEGSIEKMMALPSGADEIKDLQTRADECLIMAYMVAGHGASQDKITQTARELKSFEGLSTELSEFKKALGTATAGEGSDWVPTDFSATLIDEVRLQLKVAALHRNITMPGDPYTIPVKIGRSRAYNVAEATSDNPSEMRKSQLETSSQTLNAKTVGVATAFSYEVAEDSIIPIIPIVRSDIVASLADSRENATINGDTASSHQDTGLTLTNDDQLKLWSGYRKLCPSGTKIDFDTGTEAFTTANFRNVRKSMGKYGANPADIAWVVSIECYIRMLGLSEVLTVDKYGPNSPILTGELGKFDGSPLIVSEFVRNDLNASGVYDGTTTTETEAILVHRESFVFGDRRSITVETDRFPMTQQNVLVATERVIFQMMRPSTDTCIALGYNMTS